MLNAALARCNRLAPAPARDFSPIHYDLNMVLVRRSIPRALLPRIVVVSHPTSPVSTEADVLATPGRCATGRTTIGEAAWQASFRHAPAICAGPTTLTLQSYTVCSPSAPRPRRLARTARRSAMMLTEVFDFIGGRSERLGFVRQTALTLGQAERQRRLVQRGQGQHYLLGVAPLLDHPGVRCSCSWEIGLRLYPCSRYDGTPPRSQCRRREAIYVGATVGRRDAEDLVPGDQATDVEHHDALATVAKAAHRGRPAVLPVAAGHAVLVLEARVPVVSLGPGRGEARERGEGAGAEFTAHGASVASGRAEPIPCEPGALGEAGSRCLMMSSPGPLHESRPGMMAELMADAPALSPNRSRLA